MDRIGNENIRGTAQVEQLGNKVRDGDCGCTGQRMLTMKLPGKKNKDIRDSWMWRRAGVTKENVRVKWRQSSCCEISQQKKKKMYVCGMKPISKTRSQLMRQIIQKMGLFIIQQDFGFLHHIQMSPCIQH